MTGAVALAAAALPGVLEAPDPIAGSTPDATPATADFAVADIEASSADDDGPGIDFIMADRFDASPSLQPATAGEQPGDPWSDPEWQAYLHPEEWDVTLVGSAPAKLGTILTWSWDVAQVGGDHTFSGTGQELRWLAPELGPYDVSLTVTSDLGVTTTTERIELDDLVIAVAGDSMASGEGLPDIPGEGELSSTGLPTVTGGEVSRWVDPDCDRSANNFGALSAAQLEADDPRTSITYINVACSGARSVHLTDLVHPGVLGAPEDGGGQVHAGLPEGRYHPPQLAQLAAALCGYDPGPEQLYPALLPQELLEWFGGEDHSNPPPGASLPADCRHSDARPVDDLLLSVGINDIGFRDVLLSCTDLDEFGLNLGSLDNILSWVHTSELITVLLWLGSEWIRQGTAVLELLDAVYDVFNGDCSGADDITRGVEEGLGTLPVFLGRAAQQISESGLVAGGVYHVQYPHSVVTDDCPDSDSGVLDELNPTVLNAFDTLTDEDVDFINDVNDRLNMVVRSPEYFGYGGFWPTPLRQDPDWVGHGYCEDDSWFVSLTRSVEQYNNVTSTDVIAPTGRLVDGEPEYEDGLDDLDTSIFGILHPDEDGQAKIAEGYLDERAERNRPVTDVLEVELLSIDYGDYATYTENIDGEFPGTTELAYEVIVGRGGRYGGSFSSPPVWGSRAEYTLLLETTDVGGDPLTWRLVGLSSVVGEPKTIPVEINEDDTLLVALKAALPRTNGDQQCIDTDIDLPDDDDLAGPGTGIVPVAFALPIEPDPDDPVCSVAARARQAAGHVVLSIDDDLGWGALADGESRVLEAPAVYLGTDPDDRLEGLGGIDLTFRVTRQAANQPPIADAGGPYTVDEGSTLTLDGTGSSDPDGDPLTYSWSGAVTGSGPTVTYEAVDDAVEAVTLTVTDPDGETDVASTTITTRNVDPTVTATLASSEFDEGGSVALTLSCTDPGTQDTHVLDVDWGDATLVPPEPVVPTGITCDGSDHGPFRQAYGDDGTFTVRATVSDDDGGSDVETFQVDVTNRAPSISVSGPTVALPGGDAVFVRPGDEVAIDAVAGDAGSDDLTLTWWTGRSQTVFADGAAPDPAISPGPPFPVSVDATEQATVADGPRVIAAGATVADDDGASAGGMVTILVTGELTHDYGFGRWTQELTDPRLLTETQQAGLLDVIEAGSGVFGHEAIPLGTAQDALAVLDSSADGRDGLARDLLRAWFDVASGAVDWDEDLPGSLGVVGSLIAEAEQVHADHSATDRRLREAGASLRPI